MWSWCRWLSGGTGETALGLTGPLAAEVLARLGLPALDEPMTGARVEWNGMDLRIVRGLWRAGAAL